MLLRARSIAPKQEDSSMEAVQAGDERVTLVTYRFKYLLRHLLYDDLQHHEFHLHLRHLRIARR